ncbi:hypothetical protein IV203_034291 [Nitzschia inconspicua]|uniref:Uncharacterized protein n=1 Tax=Nitzschia inconspicua TaxID=303405 RepID=A0A9K3M472_9STRA|nr:hypothetical protein IV203_034291 [Nitzschia inconspicua]
MASITPSRRIGSILVSVIAVTILLLAVYFDAGQLSFQPFSTSNNNNNKNNNLLNAKDKETGNEEVIYGVAFQNHNVNNLRKQGSDEERKLKGKSAKSESNPTSSKTTSTKSDKSSKSLTVTSVYQGAYRKKFKE